MKSSSWIDETWQHNNRKEFFILFTSIWAAISLYNLHGSCLWQSITETGATPNPQPARGGIGLGRWLCLFPSDILSSLCSVLCASSQSAGSLSTLLSLQAGQHYWAVLEKKKKKNIIGTLPKSGTRHKQGWSDMITSKRLHYCCRITNRKSWHFLLRAHKKHMATMLLCEEERPLIEKKENYKKKKKSSTASHLTFIFQERYLTPSTLAVINI